MVTTKQLALKDFVHEPDDQKLLKGTHYIVQNLSGSLALVTCREPLKMSLGNFLKKKLEEYAFLTEADFVNFENEVKVQSQTKGKNLFMPMRVAVIGKPHGTELKLLTPLIAVKSLISRADKVLAKIKG